MTSMYCMQLLGALGSPQFPLDKAEQCLKAHKHPSMKRKIGSDDINTNVVKSHWGAELIQAVCAEEAVVEDDKLSFHSKFSLLPVDMQRNILRFILCHAVEIPSTSLETLLSILQKAADLDDWCRFHSMELLNYVKTKRGAKTNPSQNSFGPATECHHKISKINRESLDNICKQLSDQTTSNSKSTPMKRCSLKFDWLKSTSQHSEPSNLTNQKAAQKIVPGEEGIENMDIEEHQVERTDENIAEKVDERLLPHQEDELGEKTAEIIAAKSETIPDQIDKEVVSNPGDSGMRQDGSISQGNQSTNTSEINQVLKRNLGLFKTELFTCTSGSSLPQSAKETCQQILNSPAQVTEKLWKLSCIDEVPLPGLECLCKFVIHDLGATELSYSAATKMAEQCFCKKLQETSSSTVVSRDLSAILYNFAKVFPKPIIEGVLLPCVTKGDPVLSSFDIATKLCKDVLSNEHKLYFLNSLLQSKELVWCEQHTDLVQSILSSKLELDPNSLSTVVGSLEKSGSCHQSCKKFAKLLLFVINQYGKQMTQSDLGNMQRSARANKTFLKKAALNALKRLSPT